MRQCQVCNYQSWQREDNMTAVFVYHRKTNRKIPKYPRCGSGRGCVGRMVSRTPLPTPPPKKNKLLNLLNSHDIITKNKVLTSYNPKIRLWFPRQTSFSSTHFYPRKFSGSTHAGFFSHLIKTTVNKETSTRKQAIHKRKRIYFINMFFLQKTNWNCRNNTMHIQDLHNLQHIL